MDHFDPAEAASEIKKLLTSVLTLQGMTLAVLTSKGLIDVEDLDFMASVLGASPELARAVEMIEQAKNMIPEA